MSKILNQFSYVLWRPPITDEQRADLEDFECYEYIDWMPRLKAAELLSIDFETESMTDNLKQAVDFRHNQIVSAQLSFREGGRVRNLYVPLRHALYKFNWPNPKEFLSSILEDVPAHQTLVTWNAPFEYGCCYTEGFNGVFNGFKMKTPVIDGVILAWLLNENIRPKLKVWLKHLFDWEPAELANLFKNEKISRFAPEAVAPYGCQDSYGTLLAVEEILRRLQPAQLNLYNNFEKYITEFLCESWTVGVGIDTFLMQKQIRQLRERREELDKEISQCLQVEKATSSAQILKKLKARGYNIKSTAADQLDIWLSMYENTLDPDSRRGLELLRPLRYIDKHLKTYFFGKTGGIVTWLWPDNCIRPNVFQWASEEGQKGQDRGTVSGRFSVTKPSFNTFIKEPKDPDLAEWMAEHLPDIKLRRLVVPPHNLKDYVVLCGDGSQIEMRTTASATREQKLIDFFNNMPEKGEKPDLYNMMATDIFKRPITKKNKIERKMGKDAVLAGNYGIGMKKLAKRIWRPVLQFFLSDPEKYNGRLPEKDGAIDELTIKKDIEQFSGKLLRDLKQAYKGIGTYSKRVEEQILATGGTIVNRLGLSRTIPNYMKGNHKGLLSISNFKGQSEAAYICKLAMIMFRDEAKKDPNIKYPVYVSQNIHDEILAFVHRDDILAAAILLEKCFKAQECVLDPFVKLEASISVGWNWGDQIDFEPAKDAAPYPFLRMFEVDKPYDGGRVKKSIAKLIDKIKPCQRCGIFDQFGWEKVFIQGKVSTKPKLVVITGNPSEEELLNKAVLKDKSGLQMRKWIQEAGIPLQDCVFINSMFCASATSESITTQHINNCRNYVQEMLEVIAPDVVLSIGSIAYRSITAGNTIEFNPGWVTSPTQYKFFSSIHPGIVLGNPALKEEFVANLKILGDYLNENV